MGLMMVLVGILFSDAAICYHTLLEQFAKVRWWIEARKACLHKVLAAFA